MAQTQKPPTGPIRLGSKAPNFNAWTTQGNINFYEQIEDQWAILFAFPDDFTPVATTELATFAELQSDFAKRRVRLFALSTNNTRKNDKGEFESHETWVKDINTLTQTPLQFPIISDSHGTVSRLFHVLGDSDVADVKAEDVIAEGLAFKSRTVFIIDAEKRIRLMFNYPAAVGINTSEVLRAVDCLQTAAQADVRTPANWLPGHEVVVPPKYSDEEAKDKFPGYTAVIPYLRTYTLPVHETSVDKIKDIPESAVQEFLQVGS